MFAIVATGEYVLEGSTSLVEDARRYAIVVYWDGNTISFTIGDKSNEGSGFQPGIYPQKLLNSGQDEVLYSVPVLVVSGVTSEPPVSMCQVGDSLVITVFGYATYECYPTYDPNRLPGQSLYDGGSWTVGTLGVPVAPLPSKWTFLKKLQADLLVYTATNDGAGHPILTNDPLTGDNEVTRLDISADYWLSDNTNGAFYAVLTEPEWVYPSGDATEASDASDRSDKGGEANETNPLPGSANHSKSRAYGYRTVVAYTVTDSRGNVVTRYSKASADLWIEDRIYKPATLGFVNVDPKIGTVGTEMFTDEITRNATNSNDDGWWSQGESGADWWIGARQGGFYALTTTPPYLAQYNYDIGGPIEAGQLSQTFFPTADDFFALQKKFIAYGTNMASDPYAFAAAWLGKVLGGGTFLYFPNGAAPYKVNAPASELLSSPQTIFDWNDFDFTAITNIGGTPTEVLIFRTGHFGKDDKADSDTDSLSEPHVYGYAGSVSRPVNGGVSTFTDNIADNALDLGDTPDDYDGLEVGQFSGQTARDFMNQLVLGNIETIYWVDTPGPEVSANYDGPQPGQPDLDASTNFATALSGDAYNVLTFHFSYVDSLGNESALRDVTLNYDANWDNPTGDAHFSNVFLVFPRGSDPDITGIHAWMSYWDPTNSGPITPQRRYYDLGIIPVSQPVLVVNAHTIGVNQSLRLVSGRPSRTTKIYYSPNQGIYSIPNEIYSFPPLNVEQWHPFSAVVGMESVFGDLLIFLADGMTWTTLTGGTVRIEENTKSIGALSRFAICKWNKAVFFLASNGMYCAEGDGVQPMAAQVSTGAGLPGIRQYINESIPGIPRHTNANRASIGALGHQYEVWAHFPSSIDLWLQAQAAAHAANPSAPLMDISQALPQATFVYKFTTGEIRRHYVTGEYIGVENYQMDITPDFSLINTAPTPNAPLTLDVTKFRPERVLLAPHVDGTMWAAFSKDWLPVGDGGVGQLSLVNCDTNLIDWQGFTQAEKPFAIGMTTSSKQLRTIYIKAQIFAGMTLIHGIAKPDFGYDIQYGHINQACRVWPISNTQPGRATVLASSGTSVAIESKGVAPIIRIITQPDVNGNHRGEIQSINLDMALKHHHPK